jgi:hypothetical protein
LFAKEGANVLMTDVSNEALMKAFGKVRHLVPNSNRIEWKVSHPFRELRVLLRVVDQ